MAKYQARHYVATARILWTRRKMLVDDTPTSNKEHAARLAALDTVTALVSDFQREFAADSAGFDSVRFYDAAHTGKGL